MFYRYSCGCVALAKDVAGIHIPSVLIESCLRDITDPELRFTRIEGRQMDELCGKDRAPLTVPEHYELIEKIDRMLVDGDSLRSIKRILQ